MLMKLIHGHVSINLDHHHPRPRPQSAMVNRLPELSRKISKEQ
jgi:hypothetical protein